MGANRETRESEKILSHFWALIPHLQVSVWHPLRDEAIEYAQEMQVQLVWLIDQLKKEKSEYESAQWKNMDKSIHEPKA